MKLSQIKKKIPHQVALIGSPNSGKTTLFNRLTGSNQTTGNWPGVTVEKKVGDFQAGLQNYHITDLPGVYSLENSTRSGLDEKVARDFLQNHPIDLLINVVDATCLERQLFLTAQLLHMGLPVVVVLNQMDKLENHHLELDETVLSEKLGCPVIPISAYYNQGIDEFKETLSGLLDNHTPLHFDLPDELHNSVHAIRDRLPDQNRNESCWKSLHYLIKPENAPASLHAFAKQEKQRLEEYYEEDLALIAADLYFQFAHDAAHASQTHTDKFTRDTTEMIDHWTLHPIWGIPIFLGVMYLLFALSITLGNLFIDFFDLSAQALFVDAPTEFLMQLSAPEWSIALLANGIGGGLQVVATFIPVIGALFLLLSVIEETGYMQRAAFIMDRAMRKLGLSGQAFIPLVVGFGCNIPAVLASRTLPDERVRIMTIMMTPFMSCSARLTVYVLFATAFFADHATLLVFSLYLIGITAAVITALLLKHTLLHGQAAPLLMELPSYHKPSLMNVGINTYNKMKGFIFGAGKIIVVIVLLINFFNSLGTDGSFGNENQSNSVLSSIAKTATPIVEPLGVDEENWPATVGLITGILAKEVVVGALDALYQSLDKPSSEEPAHQFTISEKLTQAVQTIPDNFGEFFNDFSDPLGLKSLSSVEDSNKASTELDISSSTLTKMIQHFNGEVGAYAYLLLVLLYFPCVATFAAIRKELGWRWALSSGGWSLFLGYSTAVSFYQLMTYQQHPTSSLLWVSFFALCYLLLFLGLKQIGKASLPARKA